MSDRTLRDELSGVTRATAARILDCSRSLACDFVNGKSKIGCRRLARAAGRLSLTGEQVLQTLIDLHPDEFVHGRVDAALDGDLPPTSLNEAEHDLFLRELQVRRQADAA